jgi:hypothetical protein
MATIKHKRSSTQGAVPQLNEFAEGEILINSHDGKAFIKKVTPQGSEVVQLRNTREDVRPAGQTGEDNVSETGIRTALNELTDGIIPNYFVTNLTEFLAAYSAIRANYAGGNIYITGEIIMTQNLFLDLRGIEIIGRFCIWRHYNSTLLNPNPADVYKIIITRGSPTFRGVTFYGSSGQSSLALESGTNRHIIELNTTYTGESITVNFESCNFYDVLCGIDSPVISVAMNMANNAGVIFNFNRCRISTHNNGSIMNYAPLQISHTFVGASTTNIRVNVTDHIGVENTNKSTSLAFSFVKQSAHTIFTFHHDETAYTESTVTESNSAYMTRDPASFAGLDTDGYILITKGGTIFKVLAADFINAVAQGSGYTHPSGFTSQPATALPGLEVISRIKVNGEGHVVGVDTKTLDADKYEKFKIAYESGQMNGSSDCVGANGTLPVGGNRGLKMIAGSNISLSPYIDGAGLLNIIFTATPAPASLTAQNAALQSSMAPIAANTWVPITGLYIDLEGAGTYLVTAQVHLYRNSTGLSVIAARIYTPAGTKASGEQAPASLSVNRASIHLSTIITVSGKSWVELQAWSNTASVWGIGGSTITSVQAGATQLNVVKIA